MGQREAKMGSITMLLNYKTHEIYSPDINNKNYFTTNIS